MVEISFPQGLGYFCCCYSHLDKKDRLGITTVISLRKAETKDRF